jgi:hypothetical protein
MVITERGGGLKTTMFITLLTWYVFSKQSGPVLEIRTVVELTHENSTRKNVGKENLRAPFAQHHQDVDQHTLTDISHLWLRSRVCPFRPTWNMNTGASARGVSYSDYPILLQQGVTHLEPGSILHRSCYLVKHLLNVN